MRQARVVITGLDQVQAQKLPAEAWAVTPGVEQPGAMDDGIGVHGSGVVGGRFLASVDDAQSLRDEALASPSGLGSTIRGSLTMYFRDAPTGDVVILPDPFGSGLVFRLSSGPVQFISSDLSRLVAVARSCGVEVKKSLGFIAQLVATGSGGFGITPYEGVEVMQPGTWARVTAGGIAVQQYPDEVQITGRSGPYDEGLDAAISDLTSNAAAAAAYPAVARIAHLTGGSDSRIVVAALRHLRLAEQFWFHCSGKEGDPDYDIASRICGGLSLPLTSWGGYVEQSEATSWRESMVGTFEATSGLLGTLATVWAVPVWSLVLSGGYGEFLRSFYNRGDVVTGTTADIAQHMYGRFGMGVQDEGSILARDQKERFVAALQKRIDEGRERGVRDDAVLDYLYMTERNRFFVGEISRVLSHTIHRFDPLYSVAAANAALAMPGTERNANLLGLDMLRRLDPVLAAMPFDRERYAGLYEELRGSVDRLPLPDGLPVTHCRPPSVPQPGPKRWSLPAITPEQTARARKLSMPTRFMANYDIIQRELPSLFAQVGAGEAASAFNMTLIRRVLAAPPSSRVYYRALKNLYGLLSWYVTEPPAPAERSG